MNNGNGASAQIATRKALADVKAAIADVKAAIDAFGDDVLEAAETSARERLQKIDLESLGELRAALDAGVASMNDLTKHHGDLLKALTALQGPSLEKVLRSRVRSILAKTRGLGKVVAA